MIGFQAVAVLLLITPVAVNAEDLQLLYPDNNVSSKPVLEFRARDGRINGGTSPGHSLILLGRVLDNGTTHFYQAAGFYPKTDSYLNMVAGPGTVTYKIDDLRSDVVFRVAITNEQERTIKYIVKNWDTKRYNLATRNCNDMVADVARVVGLSTPLQIGDTAYPYDFVKSLKEFNSSDRAIEYQKEQARRIAQKRAETVAESTSLANALEQRNEKARKINAENRMRRKITPPPVPIPTEQKPVLDARPVPLTPPN